MGDKSGAFDVNGDIDDGLSIISTPDWIILTTFFESARYNQPTSEALMRTHLKMDAKDGFKPEFAETVALFQTLQKIAEDFDKVVVAGSLALADDIVHYQTIADTAYDRFSELVDKLDWGDTDIQKKLDALVALWAKGEIQGRSDQIKTRISSLLKTLAAEAASRSVRAGALHDAILADGGISDRIQKNKAAFDANKLVFEQKFGKEGSEIATLRTSVAEVEGDLTVLRQKDHDEVIVLSTSPLYLLIPFFGPFILAGVDIGVGVDLANVRAKLASKVAEAQALNDRITQDQRFMTYYTSGEALTTEISQRISTVVPKLKTLGLGWRAVASDIGTIASALDGTGQAQIRKEDWSDLIATIKTAQKNWAKVGAKADKFRSTAEPHAAANVDDLLKRAIPQAA